MTKLFDSEFCILDGNRYIDPKSVKVFFDPVFGKDVKYTEYYYHYTCYDDTIFLKDCKDIYPNLDFWKYLGKNNLRLNLYYYKRVNETHILNDELTPESNFTTTASNHTRQAKYIQTPEIEDTLETIREKLNKIKPDLLQYCKDCKAKEDEEKSKKKSKKSIWDIFKWKR